MGVSMKTDWRRRLGWTLTLFLLWLLFAQSFDYQTIVSGVAIAYLIAVLNSDLLPSLTLDLHVTRRTVVLWIVYVA